MTVHSFTPFPVLFPCFVFVVGDVSSQLPPPRCQLSEPPPHPNMGSLSGNLSQINSFVIIIVFDIGFLSWQQKRNQYKVFATERKAGPRAT